MRDVKRRHIPYAKFKGFMIENDISQKKLAALLNKSVSAVNQNLNGTGGDFSLSEIRLICREFGISADEYFLYPDVSYMKRNETA